MKYKRLIIILGSVLGLVVLCTILSFTLFRTHDISLNFQNKTVIFADEQKKQEVINSASINSNLPIYTLNKKQIVANLESRNPYLKVINIETVFPNKLVIHCAEREKLFYIKNGDVYFVCDDSLKILATLEDITTSQANPVLLGGVVVANTGASAGDVLSITAGADVVENISNAFAHSNKTIADIKGMFKQINFKFEQNNFYTYKTEPMLEFITYDNFKVIIKNADLHLITKVNIMINKIPQLAQYYDDYNFVIDINPYDTKVIYTVLEEKSAT